ncbi:1-acyl-sn-glycerol-3-phosphate acyltransferase alpha-like [Nymphalis io]|uniref:1-acyl-sn-glycerol-3-phosphate acyltransferase alpha-like n=1 Tax=Inachis io TaxID=171585 RepID=UPI002169E6FF|nr:1-acyl-sn-glycerol-3-phosphate acyltransferase alpha-like [Nymphalis io]
MNVKWHLRNFEIVSEEKGAVVLLNHQSSIDLLCLGNLWLSLGKAVCVSKKEIIYYFPFGLAMYLTDTIFIDRKNPKDAHKVLQMKAKKKLENKTKIVIFPEGRRCKDFTKLLPFKKGAFNIAVEAQVPIIPIVISRYYFKNDKEHILNGGHVIAQCLEPVSTEGLTMDDVPELINRVHSNMERVFKELSKEVVSSLPPDYPLEKLN